MCAGRECFACEMFMWGECDGLRGWGGEESECREISVVVRYMRNVCSLWLYIGSSSFNLGFNVSNKEFGAWSDFTTIAHVLSINIDKTHRGPLIEVLANGVNFSAKCVKHNGWVASII